MIGCSGEPQPIRLRGYVGSTTAHEPSYETLSLPPAYEVRRKVIFILGNVCPHLGGGTPIQLMGAGYPLSRSGRGDPLPIRTGWGYPPSGLDGSTSPCREIGRQSSYVAGGMPLAFMQEDFLVP